MTSSQPKTLENWIITQPLFKQTEVYVIYLEISRSYCLLFKIIMIIIVIII